jgi:hypothetical protein
MATLIDENATEFKVTHLEMIKVMHIIQQQSLRIAFQLQGLCCRLACSCAASTLNMMTCA